MNKPVRAKEIKTLVTKCICCGKKIKMTFGPPIKQYITIELVCCKRIEIE
jgi:hypothetical protein